MASVMFNKSLTIRPACGGMRADTEQMPPFAMRIAYLPAVEAANRLGDRKPETCVGMISCA